MKKKVSFIKAFIFFFVLFQFYSIIYSLDPDKRISEYVIKTYTTENGLPQASVLSIVQTDDKYIWLATYDGLARFDGITFRIFDKNNTNKIRNSSINTLCKDRNGILWIATADGLVNYNKNTFNFHSKKDGMAGDFVRAIFEDHEGNIWIGTTTGLSRYRNKRFKNFTIKDGLSHNYITSICQTKKGDLFIGTYRGLCILKNNKIIKLKRNKDLMNCEINTMLFDSEDRLWVGTRNLGLYSIKGKEIKTYNKFDGIDSTDIRALFLDRKNVLWVGSGESGLFHYKKNKFISLKRGKVELHSSVRSIFEDHEGSLWVGTQDGINLLKDDKFIYYNSSNGLLVNNVRTVFEDKKGLIWIGTVGGGLSNFNNGVFFNYIKENIIFSKKIWSITEDKNGFIWIGTYSDGIKHISKDKIFSFTTENGLASNVVRVVYSDKKGDIWVGTDGGGINVISPNGKILKHYSKRNGLSDDFIYTIKEDLNGNIWAGTYSGGLNKINEGNITKYGPNDGLKKGAIWALFIDKNRRNKNSIWIGTNGSGLHLYKNGRFFRITSKNGLYSDLAFTIIEDQHGYLWMNCNRGIYKVKKSDLYKFINGDSKSVFCISFGNQDGIKNTESSGPAQPVGFLSKKGKIWFAGTKGVIVIDPNNYKLNKIAPNVIIEDITVNEKFYPHPKRIFADPGKGNVKINYTALSFIKPSKVFFKYKLEGYDDKWQLPGVRRTAFYTNLPPGHYIFRVMACNNDGFWNEKGDSLFFTIKPFFYQTVFFKTFIVILLLGFIVLIYKIRTGKLKKSHALLEKTVKERTADIVSQKEEIEIKNKQLSDSYKKMEKIARTDPLTKLSNRRDFLEKLENTKNVSDRYQRLFTLVICDIDHFKKFNDKYGHDCGDFILLSIADLFRNIIRKQDYVGRWGGEEFVFLFPETNLEGGNIITEKIRKEIENRTFKYKDLFLNISMTFGICEYNKKEDIDVKLKQADEALYMGKKAGRNRVEVFQ